MKKFFKYIFLILIIFILSFGFIFRNRISLYFNVIKTIAQLKDNFSSLPTNSDFLNTTIASDSFTTKNIEYKNTNGVPLTLDIYGPHTQPKNGSPIIMYIHGGSWIYGNKDLPAPLTPLLNSFREQGYSIISVDYELLSNDINFEKQVSDVKDAIRWVSKNKDEYNFNTDEIGLIGVSSGAHLSLMAGYTDNSEFIDEKELSSYPCDVKYILDFFGPTDLSTLDINSAGSEFDNLLSQINNKSSIIDKYSPINYLKKGLPSTLIVHSESDTLVPYSNSLDLYEKSYSLGNKVKLVTAKELNHDLSNLNAEDAGLIAINVLNFLVKNSPL